MRNRGGTSKSPGSAALALAPNAGLTSPATESSTERGKVRLRVYPPAAEIYVDDRLLGSGVVIDSLLPVGSRRLRVQAQGFESHEATFEISSGQTTSLGSINLKPRDGGR